MHVSSCTILTGVAAAVLIPFYSAAPPINAW